MTAAELLPRVTACLEKHTEFWLKGEGEGWMPCRGVARADAGTVLLALPGGEVAFPWSG